MLKDGLTPRETAKRFGVSVSTVYYWIHKTPYFNAVKVGGQYLLPVRQVEKYLNNGFPKAAKRKAKKMNQKPTKKTKGKNAKMRHKTNK